MKKGVLTTIGLMSLLLLISVSAYSAPNEHLDWGAQLHAGSSSCPQGTLIINVVQKIISDDDSGIAGNAWASDDIVRQIQVIQTGPSTFCATVSYQGNFTTYAGPGPGNTGNVDQGVVGTFEGGYTSAFTAALTANLTTRTRGSIGTVDYQCDGSFDCPGYVDWTTLYFNNGAGVSLPLSWWGWVYHAGNNGSWTNAFTGNSGDITGN